MDKYSNDEDNAEPMEEDYTDKETHMAMDFIKENELPMSELLYALKYVRISNGPAAQTDEQLMDVLAPPPTPSPPPPPPMPSTSCMEFTVGPNEPVPTIMEAASQYNNWMERVESSLVAQNKALNPILETAIQK